MLEKLAASVSILVTVVKLTNVLASSAFMHAVITYFASELALCDALDVVIDFNIRITANLQTTNPILVGYISLITKINTIRILQ